MRVSNSGRYRTMKKELYDSPPRQRSNITLNRTDLFGVNAAQCTSSKVRVNDTNKKSDLFHSSTPAKP